MYFVFSERKRKMGRINQAIHEIHFMDEAAEKKRWLNRIHPLAKVIVTVVYIALVMSFPKEDLMGLAAMCLYPLVLFITGEVSAGRAFRQLKMILFLVAVIGIANPILDREVLFWIGSVPVTGGMLSMLTLVIKSVFAVFATYLLIVSTSIENICYALRKLHMPKILSTLILLIYRYIVLMLKETERLTQAYSLRAPDQKGIHYKAWGTLAGQMLLRSMDRAELVYESMTLRGFQGEFYLKGAGKSVWKSVIYASLWCIILFCIRIFPIFEMVGRILT